MDDDDGAADFHGKQRKNDTHASTSDPDSRRHRKAAGEAELSTWATPSWRTAMGWRWRAGDARQRHCRAPRIRRSWSRPRAKEAGVRITVGEDKADEHGRPWAHLCGIALRRM